MTAYARLVTLNDEVPELLDNGILIPVGAWVIHIDHEQAFAIWQSLRRLNDVHTGRRPRQDEWIDIDNLGPAGVVVDLFYNVAEIDQQVEPYLAVDRHTNLAVGANRAEIEPSYLSSSPTLQIRNLPLTVSYAVPMRNGKIDGNMPAFVTFTAAEDIVAGEDAGEWSHIVPEVEMAIDFFALDNALNHRPPNLGWRIAHYLRRHGVETTLYWMDAEHPLWYAEIPEASVNYGAELEREANYHYASKRWPATFNLGRFDLLSTDWNELDEIAEFFEYVAADGSGAYDEQTYRELADAREEKMWADMKDNLRRNLVDDVLAILFAPPALWRAGIYWLQEFDEVWDKFFAILAAEMNDGRLDIEWEQGRPFLYHSGENNGRWERRLYEALVWELAKDWRFRSDIGYSVVEDENGRRQIVLWDKESE